MPKQIRMPIAALIALLPTAAAAHTGVAPHVHSGFLAGVLHPLTGADHLAAMVAVGLWAGMLGGRAVLAVPAAFLALLAAGAALGAAGVAPGGIEPTIAASVILLGLAAALSIRVPTPAAAALVGLFAAFHGFAHGAEMPAFANPLAYGAGFLATTAMLHAAGLGAGLLLGRADGRLARILGGAVAAFGLVLAIG